MQAWTIPRAIAPDEATVTTSAARMTSIVAPTIASWR
jgi:hypothetical protein